MEKKRPFGVTLLAILAAVAAIVAIIHTLQMLHLWPIWVGPVRFFTFDLLGAILWGILASYWPQPSSSPCGSVQIPLCLL